MSPDLFTDDENHIQEEEDVVPIESNDSDGGDATFCPTPHASSDDSDDAERNDKKKRASVTRPQHYAKHSRIRPRQKGTARSRKKVSCPLEMQGAPCRAEVVNLRRHLAQVHIDVPAAEYDTIVEQANKLSKAGKD